MAQKYRGTVAECFAIEALPFDKRSTELTPKSQGT
jgi:hypothetical protein